MNDTVTLMATILFFAATAAKDAKYFPDWVRIVRLVSAVILALVALVALLD
jgi:hypothetical protein